MKKLLLTTALMLTFAFSYANDRPENEEMKTLNVEDSNVLNVDGEAFECFSNSCGDTICGRWLSGPPSDELRVKIMEIMESWCDMRMI
ncbi:MAG: hypothetical protein ACK4GN_11685 [Runella sp.]